MVRHVSLIALLAALLLAACGNVQQAAGPTSATATADAALLNEGHAPEPSSTSPAAPATSAPLPTVAPATSVPLPIAETPQLILPPATEAPTAEPILPTIPPEPTVAPAAPAAPAAPQAPAAAPRNASLPVRLVVEDIGINRPLISVGLDKNREPIVPRHDVGWYNLSAAPGQGENIVLWGHVLPFRSEPNVAPPFARLKDLKIGASVVLYDKAGNAHRYVVTKQVWVNPDQVEYILPVGQERVTMVSCIGDKVISNGSVVDMTHRLITIAEPE